MNPESRRWEQGILTDSSSQPHPEMHPHFRPCQIEQRPEQPPLYLKSIFQYLPPTDIHYWIWKMNRIDDEQASKDKNR